MIIERCKNEDEIFIAVAECIYDIVEDNTDINNFTVDVEKDCWLKAHDNDGVVGFFQFSPFNRTALKVHPFIFKMRRNLSKKAALMAKRWFNEECPGMYKSLVTQTASYNRHVRIFLLNIGFKKVGIYKDAFTKNKKTYDVIHYQLMRV